MTDTPKRRIDAREVTVSPVSVVGEGDPLWSPERRGTEDSVEAQPPQPGYPQSGHVAAVECELWWSC